MYQIRIKKSAQKELEQISPPYNTKIVDAIDGLAENPRPEGVKKLKGEEASAFVSLITGLSIRLKTLFRS